MIGNYCNHATGPQKNAYPRHMAINSKKQFLLIDIQHNVEASKKIQLMTEWNNSNYQKEKLKVWKALVVWSDNKLDSKTSLVISTCGTKNGPTKLHGL
jgi:hypothetical protein